jgi:hypothetical protein
MILRAVLKQWRLFTVHKVSVIVKQGRAVNSICQIADRVTTMWKVAFLASIGQRQMQPAKQLDFRSIYKRIIVGATNMSRIIKRH